MGRWVAGFRASDNERTTWKRQRGMNSNNQEARRWFRQEVMKWVDEGEAIRG